MTKQPNPNSKRSKRRANREFTKSRPQRRAERRLAERQKHYDSLKDTKGMTMPGTQKRW